MNNAIEVNQIAKQFKNYVALKDVSFEVKKGEIFGFLGPSGAGKTTLIKILTAQLNPSSGSASILNQPSVLMKESNQKKRFGILTDNSGLYKRLTVEENLLLFVNLYGLSPNAVEEALHFVNLTDARKKKVSQLSKGMMQRVVLARAIMHKPEILFLDEPTSALDPSNTLHIYNGLRKLNEMGTTIFLTTHDMAEAETLCDRVAFLNKGTITEIGEPRKLKQKYGQREIQVELETDEVHLLSLNNPESGEQMKHWMEQRLVKRIQTVEPSLGDIFIQLTGSEL